MSDSMDKMIKDSVPKVDAVIKYENDSCPAASESEQIDVFLETDIDIKYEFPEIPPPKKKRRGRPPSNKIEPVLSTAPRSVPLPKPCTVRELELGEGYSKKDVTPPIIAGNFISNGEKEESCARPAQQHPKKKLRREPPSELVPAGIVSNLPLTKPCTVKPLMNKDNVKQDASCPGPPTNKADNSMPSKTAIEECCSVPSLGVVDSFPDVAAIIQHEYNSCPGTLENGGASRDTTSLVSGREFLQIKANPASVTNSFEEVAKRQINKLQAALTNLTACVKTQGIKINELELKVNKVTLVRDTLKESVRQISEELCKLKAANVLETAVVEVNGMKETVEVASILNDPNESNLPTFPTASVIHDRFAFSRFNEPIHDVIDSPVCYLEEDIIVLKTSKAVQKFLDDNANLSPETSPFPANCVQLYLRDSLLRLELEREVGTSNNYIINLKRRAFMNGLFANIQKIFEKFGHQIHSLQIRSALTKEFETFFNDILRFLPNLKEFEIFANCLMMSPGCKCKSNLLFSPPDLEPPLEYLGLAGCKNATELLNRYGHQLRKLVISDKFTKSVSLSLPLLQELMLLDSEFNTISSMLMRCSFPDLSKITWKLYYCIPNPQIVLPLLRQFPKLKYFEIELDGNSTYGPSDSDLDNDINIPTLEFLVYPFVEQCSYSFLLKFPNLKLIRFVVRDILEIANKSDIFPDIHEKIATNKMYESNIWDKLLKLEVVSIDRLGHVSNFHRVEYNRLQQLLREGNYLCRKGKMLE